MSMTQRNMMSIVAIMSRTEKSECVVHEKDLRVHDVRGCEVAKLDLRVY